jgi:carbonic anhydrase
LLTTRFDINFVRYICELIYPLIFLNLKSKMKYTTLPLMGLMVFMIACNPPNKNENQNDSTEHVTTQKDTIAGNNLVKSEAPDAVNKITQGYALPRFDEKLEQSPVNILSDSTIGESGQPITFTFNTGITAVENLGHTIQLDFKEGSITTASGKTYYSKQFHFHTPSEHLIDGMTFPMEMHIVNILKDSANEKTPRYLVIAVLFKMGHENKFLTEFLNAIPAGEEKDSLAPGTVNFEDLVKSIPNNDQGYFSYKGSLTTPPFSETVDWIVKKHILEASPEQIYTIEKMEGDNARHVQALYTRKILSH